MHLKKILPWGSFVAVGFCKLSGFRSLGIWCRWLIKSLQKGEASNLNFHSLCDYCVVFWRHAGVNFRYVSLLGEPKDCQDPLSLSIAILQKFGIVPEMYQVGYTKLYFRKSQVILSVLLVSVALHWLFVFSITSTTQHFCALLPEPDHHFVLNFLIFCCGGGTTDWCLGRC